MFALSRSQYLLLGKILFAIEFFLAYLFIIVIFRGKNFLAVKFLPSVKFVAKRRNYFFIFKFDNIFGAAGAWFAAVRFNLIEMDPSGLSNGS